MDTDDLHDESGVEDRRGEGGEDTEVISEVISDSDSSRSQDTEGSGDEGEEDMGDGEEEEEDEEGDEDDEDEEDEDDEDDDGGSEVYDDDQEDDYQDLDDAAFFRVPTLEREFEPVMMIGLGEHDPLEERAGGLPLWGETEPNGVVDIAGGLGGGSAAGGAGANHVTPTHPLLMGRGSRIRRGQRGRRGWRRHRNQPHAEPFGGAAAASRFPLHPAQPPCGWSCRWTTARHSGYPPVSTGRTQLA